LNQTQQVLNDGTVSATSAEVLRNCALTWLIPGFGYWLLGRKKAFYIVSGCLFAAIIMGMILGGDAFPVTGEGRLRSIGAICQFGMGLPFMLVKFLMSRGTPLSPTYDYGTNYLLIAGMLNWLAVMDVFDISLRRK